jgi:hypothetical protein
LAKVRTTWGKASDRRQQWVNTTKTVSDVFRHRSGTGKSCRTRFDVGSERVKYVIKRCVFDYDQVPE